MRITEAKLRHVIREVLEAEGTPARWGPAISVISARAGEYVIAYDGDRLVQEVQRAVSMGITTPDQIIRFTSLDRLFPDRIYPLDVILSGIQVDSAYPGPCNGAKQIVGAASRVQGAGWGSLVYMAAIDEFGQLGADRSSVSVPAERTWQSLDRRDDLGRHPYDDINDPKTPDPYDDCAVHKGRSEQVNSSFYFVEDMPGNISMMRERGNEIEAFLGDTWPMAARFLIKMWAEVFSVAMYR